MGAITSTGTAQEPEATAPTGSWWSRLDRAAVQLEGVLRELEPERCDAHGAVRLLGLFARLRKAATAGEVITARRVEACGAHREQGHRSTAHLLADLAGTSLPHAAELVEAATRLPEGSATEEALRKGAVSAEQAAAVTKAAAADPSSEEGLLRIAPRESVRRLHERARDVCLAADDDRLGRYRRQRAARSLRHGCDDEGMVWGHFRLPPDAGATVVNRLEREADRCFRAARSEDRRAPHHQHLADALVALCTTARDGSRGGDGDAPSSERRVDMVVHVSDAALRRGRVEGDEVCMVQGAGPVPVELARDLLDDAFLKGVLVDGTDVRRVAHFGRRRPAELQSALATRAVLRDGDVICAAEGCDQRLGLEWDHRVPLAAGGNTSYENLQALCRLHHRDKTASDAGSARGADRAPP